MTPEQLQNVVEIAKAAGRKALEFYGGEIGLELKADDSPLTLADKASHELIEAALREMDADVPVLSEESPEEAIRDRKSWQRFWCVDPLDGTKEFIKESGQFTVNIALIEGAEATLGVVHVPVTGVTYSALRGDGAIVENADGDRREIRTRKVDLEQPVIVASRDHAGPKIAALLARLPYAEATSMGSSLKFCLVAEGAADFYPRLAPTCEWDTAAAQCILETAGGGVVDLSGSRLAYNKDDLLNPSLLSFGDPTVDWVEFMAPELAES
jgi:3'(2'), 5'-bisphosphate nucleotidase